MREGRTAKGREEGTDGEMKRRTYEGKANFILRVRDLELPTRKMDTLEFRSWKGSNFGIELTQVLRFCSTQVV